MKSIIGDMEERRKRKVKAKSLIKHGEEYYGKAEKFVGGKKTKPKPNNQRIVRKRRRSNKKNKNQAVRGDERLGLPTIY